MSKNCYRGYRSEAVNQHRAKIIDEAAKKLAWDSCILNTSVRDVFFRRISSCFAQWLIFFLSFPFKIGESDLLADPPREYILGRLLLDVKCLLAPGRNLETFSLRKTFLAYY